MLLGFGARNCWCFKEWLDIDLRQNNGASKNRDCSTVLGFFGANASGKTNALKVFAFISDFVKRSFEYPPESQIMYDSYFNNSDESEFYVEFKDYRNNEYRYEAILDNTQVRKEILIKVSIADNEEVLLERQFNEIITNNLYPNELVKILRSNASIISILHQYGIKEIEDVYSFFANNILNVTYSGLRYEITRDVPTVSKYYFDNHEALEFASNLIKKFDTGIFGIDISYKESINNGKIYFPEFKHDSEKDAYKLGFSSESTGTKALFINLLDYYLSLKNGGVLILDEFDINLHSDILPHLVSLFTQQETNSRKAQMVFTSLNPEILDVLGKHRAYIFEKEHGESFSFRLDEPETNILSDDNKISNHYRHHHLGGIPRIEA